MSESTSAIAELDALPNWSIVTPRRVEHVERVVGLLDHWAGLLGLDQAAALRWRQAGWLHDAFRDAPVGVLRSWTDVDAPDSFLHGPAAASRAAADGYYDPSVLSAVRWHTFGSADWDDVGLALYAADFLEPGRPFAVAERADLRARFASDRDEVIRGVIAMRADSALEKGQELSTRTLEFHREWCQ